MTNGCLERHLTSIWKLVFLVLLWAAFIQGKSYFPVLCSVLIQAKILIDISYYLTYHNKFAELRDFWKSKITVAINILNQITQVEVKFEKGFLSSYNHWKYWVRNVGFCLPCVILESEFETAQGCPASSWELSSDAGDGRQLGGEWHKVVELVLGKGEGKTAK